MIFAYDELTGVAKFSVAVRGYTDELCLDLYVDFVSLPLTPSWLSA
jgi:hypothetical protein